MADVVQVAANVAEVSNVKFYDGKAGASVVAGQPVFADTAASNKLKLCDANVLVQADCKGITMHASSDNHPLRIANDGTVDIGAALTPGQWYAVSTTTGAIAPVNDLVDFVGTRVVCLLGYGDANGKLVLKIINPGIALT